MQISVENWFIMLPIAPDKLKICKNRSMAGKYTAT